MSALVQVFERRHNEALPALMRPAFEKRPKHEIAAVGSAAAVPRAMGI
jgi:hypothetical protein